MKCKACSREAGERGFCPSHLKAYENIMRKFSFWRKALNITWKDYLSGIEENPLTGEWAKEVARCLINDGELKNVAES